MPVMDRTLAACAHYQLQLSRTACADGQRRMFPRRTVGHAATVESRHRRPPAHPRVSCDGNGGNNSSYDDPANDSALFYSGNKCQSIVPRPPRRVRVGHNALSPSSARRGRSSFYRLGHVGRDRDHAPYSRCGFRAFNAIDLPAC